MEKIKFVDVENQKPLLNSGFYVQFNPEKMSITERCATIKNNKFRRNKQGDHHQGVAKEHSDMVSLSLSLLFNSLTSFEQESFHDVRSSIAQFYKYSASTQKEPVMIGVLYGSLALVGFITSLSTTYTAFDAQGRALRAEVDLRIEGDYHGAMESVSLQDTRSAFKDTQSFAQRLLDDGSAAGWKEKAQESTVEDPLYK